MTQIRTDVHLDFTLAFELRRLDAATEREASEAEDRIHEIAPGVTVEVWNAATSIFSDFSFFAVELLTAIEDAGPPVVEAVADVEFAVDLGGADEVVDRKRLVYRLPLILGSDVGHNAAGLPADIERIRITNPGALEFVMVRTIMLR